MLLVAILSKRERVLQLKPSSWTVQLVVNFASPEAMNKRQIFSRRKPFVVSRISATMELVETTIRKAFKFRLEPTADQFAVLAKCAGTARWAYNYALAKKNKAYKENGQNISIKELIKEFPVLKKTTETWLNEVPAYIPQQALLNLEQAFVNFFAKRGGFPQFKKKHGSIPSFRIPEGMKVKDDQVYIPRVGWMTMVQHRLIEGKIKNATFKANHLGQWFVSFSVEVIVRVPEEIEVSDCRGIDVGLKDLIVDDRGHKIPAPKFYRRAERKLKRAQRKVSKAKLQGKNRAQAKTKLARLHHRVKNQREDYLHKTTFHLINDHEAIGIETLNTKAMTKTKLAKSVLDASFGEIKRQLEYKGLWNLVPVIKIDRWFPSSQLCSVCGYKHAALTLNDRDWICPKCSTHHDRDTNAGQNIRQESLRILAAGSTESLNALGVRVRLTLSATDVEQGSSTSNRLAV